MSSCLGHQIEFVILIHGLNVKVVVAPRAEDIN
jgi:hypothetical protein